MWQGGKSLGVSIDENLTWSNHINAITKKVSSGIGSIKRISHCVPPATLYNIYHGLAQSRFDYCGELRFKGTFGFASGVNGGVNDFT